MKTATASTLALTALLSFTTLGCSSMGYQDPSKSELVTIDFGSTDLQTLAGDMMVSLEEAPALMYMENPGKDADKRVILFIGDVENRTAEHIDTILTRITLAGSIYLAMVAVLPDLLIVGINVAPIPFIGEQLDAILPQFITQGMNVTFYFGGTSLLIIVGVSMDTVQQVESQLIMRHYDGFMKKTRIRGRRG